MALKEEEKEVVSFCQWLWFIYFVHAETLGPFVSRSGLFTFFVLRLLVLLSMVTASGVFTLC